MMTCKEASQLISERKDHPLPPGKRIGLWFHLIACKMCVGYKNQLQMLSRISKRAGETVMGKASGSLSSDARDRMKQRLSGND